jgi:beta-phosphoglucomutase-like phosphatase (HAD superfamily)
MTEPVLQLRPWDPDAIRVLLCDADGNLFASEEPAFVASTAVTNRLLAELGIEREFTPDELRRRAVGRNFRATAQELAAEAGTSIDGDVLEQWVLDEQRQVVSHLASVLRADPAVTEPLRALERHLRLAVVSSSAQLRLDACFEAAGLDDLFPREVRFSAEDSLPKPLSKPDPAVYRLAGSTLGVTGRQGLAIEDSVVGAKAAIAAGYPTIGNVQFVPAAERPARIDALRQVGVVAIMSSWSELADVLSSDITGHPGVPAS